MRRLDLEDRRRAQADAAEARRAYGAAPRYSPPATAPAPAASTAWSRPVIPSRAAATYFSTSFRASEALSTATGRPPQSDKTPRAFRLSPGSGSAAARRSLLQVLTPATSSRGSTLTSTPSPSAAVPQPRPASEASQPLLPVAPLSQTRTK